jgi:PAS domain S-box-containing protein
VRSAKYDLFQIIAAFALPLVLVAVAGWFSWSEFSSRAKGELLRTADGAAEYADRLFTSALLAGKLSDRLLAGSSDADIQVNEASYHELLGQVIPDLPGAISISVVDAEGRTLLMSNALPVPRLAVAEEATQALQQPDAPGAHVTGLAVGQVSGRLYFSVNVPRQAEQIAAPGAYGGLVSVAFDSHVVAAEMKATTHDVADIISLVRADGQILTTTGGLSPEARRIPETSGLHAAVAAGEERGLYEGRTIGLRRGLAPGGPLMVAFRQVGTQPVFVTVSRPPQAVFAAWRQRMDWLLAIGLPTSLALGLLSLAAVRRKNALFASRAALDASFDSAAIASALVDGANGRIVKANRKLCTISGRPADELETMRLDQLLGRDPEGSASAAAAQPVEGLVRLEQPGGGFRWVECATAPVTPARPEAPDLVVATLHDLTERKEAEERQTLLAREVDHRAKNVLALVQAVIRMARDPQAAPYADKLEGRVRALARAHELLARDRWQGGDLEDLVRDELAPFRDGARVTLSGPRVRIAAGALQPLSIALHELATNALRHGALGRSEGKVTLSWDADGEGLHLTWEEAGGSIPPVPQPSGGGLNILRGSIAQIGGTVALDWRDSGLCCRIELPVGALADDARSPRIEPLETARPAAPPRPARDLAGARVLIVEDEMILALDLKLTLADLGCEVIGVAGSLPAAEALARQHAGRIDAAVLDMNVKGDTTLELARELDAAGTACLFVTGYSALPEAAGKRWPLLRKPVSADEIAEALRTALANVASVPESARLA